MINFGRKTKTITKLSLACAMILLLGAFGCKQNDGESATGDTEEITVTNEAETSSSTVTFDSESNGNSTSDSDTSVTVGDTSTDTNTSTDANSTTDLTNATASVNSSTTNVTTSTTTFSTGGAEDQVLKLAETLAELYGTYTNKDKQAFKNLVDVKSYASKKMSAWIDNKTKGATNPSGGGFYGITTKALSSATLDSSSTSYKVLVTCQREEITEVTSSPKKNYQLLEMYFIMEDKQWKLDSAFWK